MLNSRKQPVNSSLTNNIALENMAIFPLLRELFKYEKVFTATPNDLVQEVLKRVAPCHTLQALDCIRGEGAIIKATSKFRQEVAVKVIRPALNLLSYANVALSSKNKSRDEYEKRILAVKNFKARFESGVQTQESVRLEIERNKVDYFSVPTIRSYIDNPCMALEMDWIDGVNIVRWLTQESDVKYSLDKYCTLLDCVQTVHDLGYIHRDIKADNIMVGGRTRREEKLYLVDWTTSKKVNDSSRNLTVPGEGLGTPGYSDFDQLEGGNARYADYRSDIFSLGIVLFEFWFNRPVPRLKDEEYSDFEKRSAYLSLLESKLPDGLKQIFRTATNSNRNNRYSSCKELKSDIIRVVERLVKEPFQKLSIENFDLELDKYRKNLAYAETDMGTDESEVQETIIDTSNPLDEIIKYVKNKEYIEQVIATYNLLVEVGIKF